MKIEPPKMVRKQGISSVLMTEIIQSPSVRCTPVLEVKSAEKHDFIKLRG